MAPRLHSAALVILLGLQASLAEITLCTDRDEGVCAAPLPQDAADAPARTDGPERNSTGIQKYLEPETLWERILNPWFWSPADPSSYAGFHWPDYSEDIPRWTSFLVLVAFLLLWVGILPDDASI